MRKALRNIRLIETFLLGRLPNPQRQALQSRLLTDPAFQRSVAAQKSAYRFIRWAGRRQLKRELKQIHRELEAGS